MKRFSLLHICNTSHYSSYLLPFHCNLHERYNLLLLCSPTLLSLKHLLTLFPLFSQVKKLYSQAHPGMTRVIYLWCRHNLMQVSSDFRCSMNTFQVRCSHRFILSVKDSLKHIRVCKIQKAYWNRKMCLQVDRQDIINNTSRSMMNPVLGTRITTFVQLSRLYKTSAICMYE